MAVRIVVLLIVAGLGAFVWTTKDSGEEAGATTPAPVINHPEYFDPDIKGIEPDSPPEFNVDVELRMNGERGDLYFTITEAHGWYADVLYIDFWYVEEDEDAELRQIGDPVTYMCHHFLPAGEPLEESTTLLDLEFPELDGWGTSENWRARVSSHRKVIAPEPAN